MSISLKLNRIILQSLSAASLATAIAAGAQGPATPATTAAVATPADAANPAPAAAAAPTPLSTFVLTGPLQWLPPATFDAGPLGKLYVNGIVTGFSQFQTNHVPGDDSAQATLSNGQVFIQRADGKVQYYIQAGVYTMQALSAPFVNAQDTMKNFYGPVPVAYLKLQAAKNTQFLIGSLPTLMGAESTFTYQNFNIERGIVWNQENAVNRGIQVNQTLNKYLSASVSWNDGYYSNRYSWLSGSVTLTKGPHVLVYDGMGNLGQTKFETAATPIQNNGYMHAVIYTYAKGPWIVSPYFQYGNAADQRSGGCVQGNIRNRRGAQCQLRLQERILASGARGIPDEFGEHYRRIGEHAGLWGRQRRHHFHRDADLPKGRRVRSRRSCGSACNELYAGKCLWHNRNGCRSIPRRA